MQTFFCNLRNYLNKSVLVQRARKYNRIAFSPKYLLYTNVGISVSLSSVGDTMEQQYEIFMDDLDKFSGKRTTHMALSGATVGVVCHFWYKFLDKRLPGRNLSIVLKKGLILHSKWNEIGYSLISGFSSVLGSVDLFTGRDIDVFFDVGCVGEF